MTSFQLNTRQQHRIIWLDKLLPLIILLISFFADILGGSQTVKAIIRTPLQPLQQKIINLVVTTLYPVVTWQNATQAQRRVQLITQQYAEATAQLEELDQLRMQNSALRALLQASESSQVSRVVTSPITAFGKPAIGAGRAQGINTGALVLIHQVLVGRVSSADQTQSQVELLTSQLSQPLLVRTASGVEGLVKGDDRRLLLTEIPLNKTIVPGERVVTVGQLGVPDGLLVGQVAVVEPVTVESAQTAVLDQLVSFFAESVVEVRP